VLGGGTAMGAGHSQRIAFRANASHRLLQECSLHERLCGHSAPQSASDRITASALRRRLERHAPNAQAKSQSQTLLRESPSKIIKLQLQCRFQKGADSCTGMTSLRTSGIDAPLRQQTRSASVSFGPSTDSGLALHSLSAPTSRP
jgi:hypothetical protein